MKYKLIHQLAGKFDIILGSKSPRRVSLLKETGIQFSQIIPEITEKPYPDEHPYHYAERLAKDKAIQVANSINNNQLVIGCDTVVVLGDKAMGKPVDENDAFEMLLTLSGRQHIVCTAIAFADKNTVLCSGYELTKVHFKQAAREEIEKYITSGEPLDKAGAYGIQGMGAFLVDRIEGNLDNVIGFPRELFKKLARRIMKNMETDS